MVIPWWIWVLYAAAFLVMSALEMVGTGVFNIVGSSDVNSILTYNVDEVSSGSGFTQLARGAFTAGNFLLTLVPKLITWNFWILSGPVGDLFQLFFIFVFGGSLMVQVTMWAGSLLQRVF